jgi:hypothetical protein
VTFSQLLYPLQPEHPGFYWFALLKHHPLLFDAVIVKNSEIKSVIAHIHLSALKITSAKFVSKGAESFMG